MLNWLLKRHKHSFGTWQVIRSLSNNYGQTKLVQCRLCSECGYVQLDVQEK